MGQSKVSTEDHREPRLYEIRIEGHLDAGGSIGLKD
ncbi:hypothetical protein J2T14_005982 [Paenibacillus harenae]|nr:hypothetical protein [Paenibacillus harenae]